MRRLGRTGHKDANQDAIVEALRKAGASVLILSGVGYGCPDLLVGFRRRNILMEVKAPGGKLTTRERKFAREWAGLEVQVVDSPESALALLF